MCNFCVLKVRFRVQKDCRPLHEDEFRPIIADNYYEKSLFWFELDRRQTRRLVDMFLSTVSSNIAPTLHNTAKWNRCLEGITSSSSNKAIAGAKHAISEDISGNQHKMDKGPVTWASPPPVPQRSWRSLFKNAAASDSTNKEAKLKNTLNAQASAFLPVLDQSNVDWESTSAAYLPERHDQHFESSSDPWEVEEYETLLNKMNILKVQKNPQTGN